VSRRVRTVSELIAEVNELLGQGFSGLWVEGEVTNASTSPRGHLYFTLKDESATLDCVMWGSRARKLRFQVEDGLAALALGALTIYPQRGRFQLVVEDLQPQGQGALQLAFEQLKMRLAAEGLFAEERKRPLPEVPQRVGIVTSPTGAALRDMLKVLLRLPNLQVLVAPVRVQGEGAATEIAAGIEALAASGKVDVVVVARGGGSLEDLWAFNEEAVARAIASCPLPVISGVGHEVDFTIADFVADLRAATPTQAAEMIVSRLEVQMRRVEEARRRLERDLRRHLELARANLARLEGSSGLARLPQRVRLAAARLDRARQMAPLIRRLLERSRGRLEVAAAALRRVPGRVAAGSQRNLVASRTQLLTRLVLVRLERARHALDSSERALGHLSPRAVLERGYSITRIEERSAPVRDAASVRPGQTLITTVARGSLRSVVAGKGPRRTAAARRPAQPGLFEGGRPEEAEES